jgi:hypothetical protein
MIDSSHYNEITEKIDKLTFRERLHQAVYGAQIAVVLILGFFLLLSLTEHFFRFSSTVRTVLFFLFLVASLYSIYRLFLHPFALYIRGKIQKDHHSGAKRAGEYFPEIKDELLNALQLIPVKGEKKYYSEELIRAAFERVYQRTNSINFSQAVKFDKAKKALRYTIPLFVFFMASFVLSGGLQAASYRLFNFGQNFIPPRKYSFIIEPGNYQLAKGENITLSAKVTGEVPLRVFAYVKYKEEAEYSSKLLIKDSLGYYNYEIPAVRSSFTYYFSADGLNSETYSVEITDKPIIRSLQLSIVPPAYSRLPEVIQKDNGNITALKGSLVNFRFTSTKPLRESKLVFTDSSEVKLQVSGVLSEGRYRIKENAGYKIAITDASGANNDNPISYMIETLTDGSPAIDAISPNKDVNLGEDNRVPLYFKISDDYGFSALALKYRLAYSKFEQPQNTFKTISLPFAEVRSSEELEQTISYVWNLSKEALTPEDVIEYYLEVTDNDRVSGPKSTRSPSFKIRVPSLDELFANTDKAHAEAEQDLSKMLEEAKELKKDLEKISQELKKDKKEITYQEKEKIQKALEKFEEVGKKAEEMSSKMSEMRDDMQKNNLLSKETMEKYMELQNLMNELTDDEMKKAMEKLGQSLQKMDRQQVQEAMKNMQMDEEAFRKGIERTLNLMKRIQVEQKTDELVKRAEDINKRQNELKTESKQNSKSSEEKNKLAEEQSQISKDLEKLSEEMKNLQEKMESMKDMPAEDMQKMSEEMEKQNNGQLSENAKQDIQKGDFKGAQESQSQVAQNMQNLSKQMKEMSDKMQQENQMQTFTNMMKIMDNLVSLSGEQEGLKKNSEGGEQSGESSSNRDAKRQNELLSGLDKITSQMSELSNKTFAITPEMGKAIGNARSNMRQALQAMQNNNSSMTSISQGAAMKSVNEAATMMKSAMESMMQGGGQGGGGMMSLMQQLQQLSQQQMNINDLTQAMQQGNLSMQQQAEMQRLAQQQELVRKSLEQLNDESKAAGQSKKIPANLENIINEMKEVVSDMRSEDLSDDIVQKQERILSRLLDAQRSMNDRDFNEERESKSGKTYARSSPDKLNLNPEGNKIKDELKKAANEGYAKDYEALIRKYYEFLEKEKISQ